MLAMDIRETRKKVLVPITNIDGPPKPTSNLAIDDGPAIDLRADF
jgi:hypothetical protein